MALGIIGILASFGFWEIFWVAAFLILSTPVILTINAVANITNFSGVAALESPIGIAVYIFFLIPICGGFVWLAVKIHQHEFEEEQSGL